MFTVPTTCTIISKIGNPKVTMTSEANLTVSPASWLFSLAFPGDAGIHTAKAVVTTTT